MAHPDQLRITAVCGGEPDGIRKQNLIKLLSSCEWVLSNIYQFTPAGVNYELASDSKSLRVKDLTNTSFAKQLANGSK